MLRWWRGWRTAGIEGVVPVGEAVPRRHICVFRVALVAGSANGGIEGRSGRGGGPLGVTTASPVSRWSGSANGGHRGGGSGRGRGPSAVISAPARVALRGGLCERRASRAWVRSGTRSLGGHVRACRVALAAGSANGGLEGRSGGKAVPSTSHPRLPHPSMRRCGSYKAPNVALRRSRQGNVTFGATNVVTRPPRRACTTFGASTPSTSYWPPRRRGLRRCGAERPSPTGPSPSMPAVRRPRHGEPVRSPSMPPFAGRATANGSDLPSMPAVRRPRHGEPDQTSPRCPPFAGPATANEAESSPRCPPIAGPATANGTEPAPRCPPFAGPATANGDRSPSMPAVRRPRHGEPAPISLPQMPAVRRPRHRERDRPPSMPAEPATPTGSTPLDDRRSPTPPPAAASPQSGNRAARMSTRSPRNGIPSASSSRRCRSPLASEPSARTIRCHGTSSPTA